jgi:DNA-binding LytR/AlgR family response regulator
LKITIVDKQPDEEDEILVKCSTLDDSIVKLLNSFKSGKEKLIFYKDEKIVLFEPKDIFYFESVDDHVFAYTKDAVYESKEKLYQLEQELPPHDFMRANKAVILNLNKVQSLSPAFGGRFEAVLKNECKIIISRMYVAALKEMLGL